jgi:GntR family transcriptional repressor for pyruvate dehydrogenase complex
MLKTATRSTLHEDVLRQLQEAIENEVWLPGSRLPAEQVLAHQFGVSRNCIREAIKVLANKGIVKSKPGSGTFLTDNAKNLLYFSDANTYIFEDINLKELIEVRCHIEGQVAYYAAKRASAADIEELESLLYETDDLETLHEMHIRFHKKISQMSGNKLLERILASIQAEMAVQRDQYKENYTIALKGIMYNHSELLTSLKSGDPRRARKAMIDHITSVWSSIFGVPLDI